MQTKLIHTEKMSALGSLVAGIAHEINNPVGFINGNLNHLQEYGQDLLRFIQLYQKHYPHPDAEIQAEAEVIELAFIQEDLPKILNSMKLGTNRISEIVLSLRNFSRMDEAEFKAVDIHDGIESTLLILQHRLKAQPERPAIQLVKNYGDLPLIECSAGSLNQVFMNILANGIDALEEHNGNRTYEDIQANPNQITIHTTVIDSSWVEIAIADNGPGIPEHLQQRIFNPFFTTKPVGKGTGIGMSISYQIVTEKHGGNLTFVSSPGQGTQFIIQIPIHREESKEKSSTSLQDNG
ncbi:MAG: ATP-binding protein [Cyanobacteria bacterium P01_F01_bin.86]